MLGEYRFDFVSEAVDGGIDTIVISSDTVLSTYTLRPNVEHGVVIGSGATAATLLPGRYMPWENGHGAAAGRPYVRLALVHDAATTREALERFRDTLP